MKTTNPVTKPTKSTAPPIESASASHAVALVNPKVVTEVRASVASTMSAVTRTVGSLAIVCDDDYHAADLLLVQIRQSRKRAEELFAEKVRGPILEPMRKALDGLYQLERELTKEPFEKAEREVKTKMAMWQDAERRRIAIEREKAEAEQRRLDCERLEAERQAQKLADAARTKLQREKAEAARLEAEAKRLEAEEANRQAQITATQSTVRGVGSKVTVIRRPVVYDLEAFAKAALKGEIPIVCLQANEEALTACWENDRGLVSTWPGVKIEETTRIGGR